METKRVGALVVGAALLVAACGTVDTSSAESALSNASGDVTQRGPMGPGLMGLPRGPRLPLMCDASPDKTTQTICGTELPATAHFEWTDCTPQPPQGKGDGHGGMLGGPGGERGDRGMPPPDGDGPPPDGMDLGPTPLPFNGQLTPPKLSGSLDVTNEVTALSTACSAAALYDFKRTETFATSDVLPSGELAEGSGTIVRTSQRTLAATDFDEAIAITNARTIKDASGNGVRSASTSGSVTESLAAGTKTSNGTVTTTHEDGKVETVTIAALVQPPPETCRFPVSGSVTIEVSDGTSHSTVFGPACGAATLDGNPIDLAQGPGGRGGHRGPPPGL